MQFKEQIVDLFFKCIIPLKICSKCIFTLLHIKLYNLYIQKSAVKQPKTLSVNQGFRKPVRLSNTNAISQSHKCNSRTQEGLYLSGCRFNCIAVVA